MGFLKKSKVPNELPDLALEGSFGSKPVQSTPVSSPASTTNPAPVESSIPALPKLEEKKEIRGEDYLEFNHPVQNPTPQIERGETSLNSEIKKQIDEHIDENDEIKQAGFFDKILEDVNGEIEDLGKIEEWYEKKFLPQDVVSNMRGYWEGNKNNILIQSFGNEYKAKIKEKIKELQELEGDWREIYFKLIKKEEDMKKVERELKDTLSEFVELCKRRKNGEGEN